MREFAAVILSLSFAALPTWANSPATDAAKDAAPATASTPAATPAQPKEAANAAPAAIESQLDELRSLVQNQMQELEAQRAALRSQQLKMDALEEELRAKGNSPSASAPAQTSSPASATSAAPTVAAATPSAPSAASTAAPAQKEEQAAPLYIKIGNSQLYPLGFMDLTNFWRSTNVGSGIGTNFAGGPFATAIGGRISEDHFSAQNSRVGFRITGKAAGGEYTGYLESDFLGFLAPNGFVTSNSDSLRLRLYWAQYRRGPVEVLGGQSWTFLTPNRNGLSALPGDLFYSQDMDTNYQLGLTWSRQAGVRFILHPSNHWAIGASFENPQQLLPGSVVLPTAVPAGLAGSNYGNQFDVNSGNPAAATAATNTSIPNLHPDVILKTAFDGVPGGHHVHFEVAGLLRSFKVVNLVKTPFTGSTVSGTPVYNTIHGGGISAAFNVELVKNFRFITTAFYSYGGGRYIGNASIPDVIIKPDGTLSGVHSGSGITGFEYQINPKWMVYGYYSGAYAARNFGQNPGASTFFGFGAPGSASSASRYLYEPTIGVIETLWRSPNYGDMKVITQYSYVSRTPWAIAAGAPATAHFGMAYVDLRYDIP